MIPISDNHLVRLLTTVSPTHLTTLLVSLGSCDAEADACGTAHNQLTSVRSPEPIMLFSLRSPLPFAAGMAIVCFLAAQGNRMSTRVGSFLYRCLIQKQASGPYPCG